MKGNISESIITDVLMCKWHFNVVVGQNGAHFTSFIDVFHPSTRCLQTLPPFPVTRLPRPSSHLGHRWATASYGAPEWP